MIPPDLDIEELQAIATPRDWPVDFDKPIAWNVCGECLRFFLGIPKRTQCRVCGERRTV